MEKRSKPARVLQFNVFEDGLAGKLDFDLVRDSLIDRCNDIPFTFDYLIVTVS